MPRIPVSTKCRLQSGYKMQTENLKSFYVWYIITCHLTAYRASRNRFSAISLHDYLHYCGKFLAHFLMKIDRNIISSLQHSLLTLRASWLVWVCTDFTNVIVLNRQNGQNLTGSSHRAIAFTFKFHVRMNSEVSQSTCLPSSYTCKNAPAIQISGKFAKSSRQLVNHWTAK